MGKKIIFLEDKPGKLKTVLSDVKDRSQETETEVLYYNSGNSMSEEEVTELKQKLDTEIKEVNIFNFDNVLDDLYSQANNLFVFDTVLNDDVIEIFSYRINVSYALRKMKCLEGKKPRIWFYTVAGMNYEREIKDLFKDYVLQAEMEGGDLRLNFDASSSFKEALMSVD